MIIFADVANAPFPYKRPRYLALALLLTTPLSTPAADVVVQPASGSGFVVKDASGANERLRVQDSGAVTLPGIPTAPAQSQGLCMGAGGQLGPCSGGGGGSYTAGTGLALSGTAFSVAPAYQLPQGCASNQIPQWNGTAWTCASAGSSYAAGTGLALSGTTFSVGPTYQLPQTCGASQVVQWTGTAWACTTISGGGTLPAGTVNQTLRYNASNALVANDLLQAFDDGALVAGGTVGTGAIPVTGSGTRMMWYPAKAAFRAGGVNTPAWDDANVGQYSVAMGQNPVASGKAGVSMGLGTTASGDYSVALGYKSNAGALGAIALGNIALATNAYSTAIGDSAQATGVGSVSIGQGTHATGDNSTALGANTTASNITSTAMGLHTEASGETSTAMGLGTVANGKYSTAMGNTTQAGGLASTAMGTNTVANGDYSTAMGYLVDTLNHKGSFIYGDNTARPAATNSADNQFKVVAYGGIQLQTGSALGSPVGAELLSGSGTWTMLSDRNAKTAVQPVDALEVLKKVVALPLNTWQYKTQDEKYRHMGPMAQDFYAAFHLGESDRGITTVDADGVALAAIQGLYALLAEKDAKLAEKDAQATARLDEKDREIAALKTRVASLESLAGDMAEVKSQLAALRKSHSTPAVTVVALQQP